MESNTDKKINLKQLGPFNEWIPKKIVQDYFGYGNTKMSTFGYDHNVRTSKIGRRLFYRHSDIIRLLEESIVN